MNRRLFIGIGAVLTVIAVGVGVYYFFNNKQAGNGNSDGTSSATVEVSPEIDNSLEVVNTEIFKSPSNANDLNIIGRIRNSSSREQSANVQIAITTSNGSVQHKAVAVNKIPANGTKQFGTTEEGYTEDVDQIQVKVTVVATFTEE